MVDAAPAGSGRRVGAALTAGLAVLGASALVLLAPTVHAQSPSDDQPASDVVVDDPAEFRGEDAVEVMDATDATAPIAEEVDLTPTELVEELRHDDTMFVTGDGQVGYADVGVADGVASLDAPLSAGLPAGTNALALHSNPQSARVLLLDFTGHTTSGTYWNSNYTGGAPIDSAPYSRDGNPAFSDAELDEIYEIWQRVAEDYAPFDIDVTTADPGTNGLRRTSASDQAYGQRMVVSPTDWYAHLGTIGIALVGVFDANTDQPGFVFVSQQFTPDAADVAEAISHEAGHTLGLRHDGIGSSEYFAGSSLGTYGRWAPLMGNPIGSTVSQWSKGQYDGATNKEDDIAKIVACAGVLNDDRPDSGTGGPATPIGTPVRAVLGAFGDVDVFPVDVGAGSLTVTVVPDGPGSNLLPVVRVRNAAGTVVGSWTPSAPIWSSASVSVGSVPAGHYIVEVSPVGYLDVFTSYGSMGGYQLTVMATPAPQPSGMGPASAYATAVRLSRQPTC